jgi:hypothetical protein
MNRGLSFLLIALGTAWLLAGSGAAVRRHHRAREAERAALAAKQVAEEEGSRALEAAKKNLTAVTEREVARLKAA